MNKYDPLFRYLSEQKSTKVTLSLSEIETIINDELPTSAYSYEELQETADVLVELEETEITALLFKKKGFAKMPEWNLIKELSFPSVLSWSDSRAFPLNAVITGTAPKQYIECMADLSDGTVLGIKALNVSQIKMVDAKLFLIKMQQEDGREHSTIKTVRGVLRPAFQMAVDDDVLMKNPFQFELAEVVVNDAVTREAVTKDQMRKFLKFIHDDVVYCKYYEVIYILFHTGMRISEFCGLTMRDIDLEKRTININHQLQRTSKREYVIEPTKTNAGTRVIPMTNEVTEMFRAIIEDRPDYKVEKVVDGYTGFLFLDKDGMPLVAMHWEHRFNHMVTRYNEIYKVQMPNITPHVCRHTYCSNMAKSGMNPKTLQYLMGHSDIAVTLNVYTHVGLEDAEKEL